MAVLESNLPVPWKDLQLLNRIDGARLLKALRSEPPPDRKLSIPEGEFSKAPPLPEDLFKGNEELAVAPLDLDTARVVGRDAESTTYRRLDGMETVRLYGEPVNFRDADGEWRAIDTKVVADDSGGFRNSAGPTRFTFAGDTSLAEPVGIAGEGWSMRFGLQGAAEDKQASTEGSTVTYGDVSPGLDLTYEVGAGSLKETIVLRDVPAAEREGRFRFPISLEGVSAVAQEDGVALVNSSDQVIARIPDGNMWDSASGEAGPARSIVDVGLAVEGDKSFIDVSPSREWLEAPERVYPVFVDPTITLGSTGDTYAYSFQPSTSFSTQDKVRLGTDSSGTNQAYMRFDVSSLAGQNIQSAIWNGYFSSSVQTGFRTDYNIHPVSASWTASTLTWSNKPALRSETISDQAKAEDTRQVDLTNWVRNWVGGAWANNGIELEVPSADTTLLKEIASSEYADSTKRPFLDVTYQTSSGNQPPPEATAVAPSDGATVITRTPQLQVNPVTDPNGDPVQYWFRVSEGFEGAPPGQLVESGWISSTSWTVPANTLQDGVTYSWNVSTSDGTNVTNATWSRSFTVDPLIGSGSSPEDSFGPVTTNLVTGNVSVATSSPSFPTVGGSVGASYTYNSQSPLPSGLLGEYSSDDNANQQFDDNGAQMTRVDERIEFSWGFDSPYPSIPDDDFLVRWTGFVKVPNSGSWLFGAASDDGVRIWINNVLVLDRWFDQNFGSLNYGNSISLTGGQAVPMKVEYFESGVSARISMRVRGPGVANDSVVPSDWLSGGGSALPDRWILNTGAQDLSYVQADVNDQSVALVGPAGDAHVYKRNGTGFSPPPGEDGILATDAGTGNLVLHDVDGMVYTFRSDGKLERAVSGVDDLNPSAPAYVWSGTPPRLTTITDPVSERQIDLAYGGGDCPSPPAGGFDSSPPAGVLCRIVYWDDSQTHLFYSSGQLARIQDPGGEITDFAYSGGRLTQVRDSLAADAIAAGQRADDATATTTIAYDGSGRASSVTLPAALAGATRLVQSYTYNASSTTVNLPGVTNHRVASFDSEGRVTQETAPDGTSQTFEWGEGDLQLSTTDPAGRKSTTIYDAELRPTDTYGPAPASWFGADRRPLAANAAQTPTEQTSYDEGISSLAATYWANATLSGTPKCHDTGVGHPSGALSKDWGAGGPSCLSPTVDNWSGRFTGEVLLPQTGTYTFRIFADGGARLWVDDLPLVDSWADATGFKPNGTFQNNQANSRHRIRLDYAERTGSARLELHWTTPGGTQELLPGANLFPRYGLTTSELTEDAQAGTLRTSTTYASPHLGLPTATSQDPGGLNLTSSVTYESGGRKRPVSRTLPAGNTWTYTYYGDTEFDGSCGIASVVQAGFLKKRTGPDPDGAGSQAARTEEFDYDAAGRVKAVDVAGNRKSCTDYDARGRVTEQDYQNFGGEQARNVRFDYAVGGNPLKSSVNDTAGTITTTVDLLGRVVSYTDVWGKTTAYTYDGAGRVLQTSGPAGVQESVFDAANGRLTSQKLDGASVAEPAYSAAGEVSSVSYPTGLGKGGNGTSLSSIGRDPSGRTTSLAWLQAGGLLSLTSDQVTRSQSGRVIDQSIDGTDARSGDNFIYDGAARLTNAWVPGRNVTYSYAPSGGCGSLATAGKNTNRTSMTVNGGAPTTYCYDQADRLTSTSDTRYNAVAPVYDERGNTKTLGSEQMTYDGADRHVKTVKAGTTVTYVRDASDRIVKRTVAGVQNVAFRSKADNDSGLAPALSLTINKPAGVVSGDVMIMHLAYRGAGTVGNTVVADPEVPSGWSKIDITNVGSNMYGAVYRKTATSSEQASYDVSFGTPVVVSGAISAWSGAQPIVSSTQASGTGSSMTTPSVFGWAGGRVIGMVAVLGSPVAPPSGPPTATERWERSAPGVTPADRVTSEGFEEFRAADGDTGDRAATGPASAVWVGHRLSLKPATATSSETRYSYEGDGDSPDATLNSSSVVTERTIPLVGGTLLTKRSGGDVWSYPNIHGDVVATANSTGVKQGATRNYDPFGEALGGVPDNSAGNFDFGWLGSHQRVIEAEAGIATIEMGARPYVPGAGRFLSVDPVEGGCANDYAYVGGDPLSQFDLDGTYCYTHGPPARGDRPWYGYRYVTSGHVYRYQYLALRISRTAHFKISLKPTKEGGNFYAEHIYRSGRRPARWRHAGVPNRVVSHRFYAYAGDKMNVALYTDVGATEVQSPFNWTLYIRYQKGWCTS
jgi:RHS repeat-associated protein